METISRQSFLVTLIGFISISWSLLASTQDHQELKAKCDSGDVEGCYELGRMLDGAHGVEEDKKEAFRLYEYGCENGHLYSCHSVSSFLLGGYGGAQIDVERALELSERNCEKDHPQACTWVATIYLGMHGVLEPDSRKAVPFLEKACAYEDDATHASCALYASFLALGRGVKQDDDKAIEIALRACEKGNGVSCWYIADGYYGKNDGYYRKLRRDDFKALEYYQRGCELGRNEACGMIERAQKRVD